MKKEKVEQIILMILVFCGLNYMLYSFYFKGQFEQLTAEKNKYNNAKDKVTELRFKKVQVNNLIEENEKLKSDHEKLDELIPAALDTPQIIYDFYTACKKYSVTGENLEFKRVIQEGTQIAQEGNEASANNSETVSQGYEIIEIKLSFSGKKSKVEEFIKKLDKITSSKLDVQRIAIAAKLPEAADLSDTANQIADEILEGEVTFAQYIQKSETDGTASVEYDFYNVSLGFDKIADMFEAPKNKE